MILYYLNRTFLLAMVLSLPAGWGLAHLARYGFSTDAVTAERARARDSDGPVSEPAQSPRAEGEVLWAGIHDDLLGFDLWRIAVVILVSLVFLNLVALRKIYRTTREEPIELVFDRPRALPRRSSSGGSAR